jgi:ketosteroid isomerase-like protein
LILCAIFVGACAHGSARVGDGRIDAGVQQQLEAAMHESAAAWNRGDVDTFLAAYEDAQTTAFMGPQITYGIPDIKARYLRSYFKDGRPKAQLTYDDLKYRPLGADYVLMTGRWHLADPETGKKQDGYYSLLWEKTPSGWKIIHDHSS